MFSIPKTISLINFKGGVGKTTLTWCLGDYFTKIEKKRLLLFDCDAQMSLTSSISLKENGEIVQKFDEWLEESRKNKKTILDVLDRHIKIDSNKFNTKDLSIYKINNNYHFIPAVEELYWTSLDKKYNFKKVRSFIDIVIGGINSEKTIEPYDYILFDCPPNFTALSYSIIANCDLLLIPVNPDFYASRGVTILTSILKEYVKPLRVPNTAVFINKAKTNNQYKLTKETINVATSLLDTCNEIRKKEKINIRFINQPILDRVAIQKAVTGRDVPSEILMDMKKLWGSINSEIYGK